MIQTHRRIVLAAALAAAVLTAPVAGQLRLRPLADDDSLVGLGLVLRKLNTVGALMMATAHPDDENSGLLVRMGLGQGIRTALVSATRGDGGQNEIGPELFDGLAVLRTEELLAVHRFDGAEQYFTRAVDFGYSFSIDETFERWGRDEIVSDFVRMIRTLRPDVITTMRPDGRGGGQHHQASAVLAHEAFKAAGDPARYPEQMRAGLRAWQPKKLYYMTGFGPQPPAEGRFVTTNLSVRDPLLGRTYAEIGTEARSMHKCQGMAQLLALPGQAVARYQLVDTAIPGQQERDEQTLFDGVDASLTGLAQYAGAPPPPLVSALEEVAMHAGAALRAFESGTPVTTPVFKGLAAVRSLRSRLTSINLTDAARFEIDFRLEQKERQFEQAATLAYGMRFEALADDGLVVAGQPVKVTLQVANYGPAAVTVKSIALAGLDGASSCLPGSAQPGQVYNCGATGTIPAGATPTSIYWTRLADADRYEFAPDVPFGLPFRPTPFKARFSIEFPEGAVTVERPVQYRYEGNIFSGEKRLELKVVPALALEASPDIAIVPVATLKSVKTSPSAANGPTGAGREIRVTVINGTKGGASAEVTLDVPKGWRVAPPTAPVSFGREDEATTVRFTVTPEAAATTGVYRVAAVARLGGTTLREGYQVIEYPHIQRRHIVRPAETTVKILDVSATKNLTVGYVMGVGDRVAEAIEQLGVKVNLIGRDELAWGDLSHYDAIVTGVRAYERRGDLRAHNHRLLEYAENGGTLVVQYNKFEFNEAQYGPFPVKVSSNRVTDENAPVRMLVPAHPAFTTPNRIGPETWSNWVQERGLYFLGEQDPRYVDLVELEDPFAYNAGVKHGALVEARVGKGRWIYIGLGLWRQLPAGTEGAYRLLANLISLKPGSNE